MNTYEFTSVISYIKDKRGSLEDLSQLLHLCIHAYLQYKPLDYLEYFLNKRIISIDDKGEIQEKTYTGDFDESYKKKIKNFVTSHENYIFVISDTLYEDMKEYFGYDDVNKFEQQIESQMLESLVKSGKKTYQFKYKMGSLRKFTQNGKLTIFNSFDKLREQKNVCIASKIDGVSLYLEYRNKENFIACRRGNGEKGDIINDKIKHFIDQYSKQLDDMKSFIKQETLYLRGELYTNDRNITAGILNRKTIEEAHLLKILFYELFNLPKKVVPYSNILGFLEKFNLPVVKHIVVKNLDPKILCDIHKKISVEDVPEDGLVLTIDDEYRIDDTLLPKNRIAWKKIEEGYETKVLDIKFEVGKTKAFTPVVIYEPIIINGKKYEKATLSNINKLTELGINIGSKIWIQIAGKIIPYVLRAEPSSTPYKLPETCNECGGVLDKTTTGLACNNIICLGVVQRKIEAFLPTYITKGASKSLAKKITQSFILNLLDDDYRIDDKMEFSPDGRCVSYPKELIEFINLGFPAIVFKYIGIDALVAMGYKLDGKTIGDIHNKMINFKEELPKSPIINFIGALGIQGLGRKQVENIFEESMINSTVICRNYKSINIEQINLKKILNKKLVDNFENITNLLEIMMN
jgi:NAD-dependent DNA ligase